MSRYAWPRAPGADAVRTGGDDKLGRGRYNARFAVGLVSRADDALAASRRLPERRAAAGPFAPADGRQHLWHALGPSTLLRGQAESEPRVCGRINALCVHDGGLRLYAASANGGVWYSKDGGAHWTSVAGLASTNTAGINRPAQRNACGALHVDFGTNEGDDLVYLGTGEVTHPIDGSTGSSEGGVGILVADKPTKSALPDPWVREAPNLVNDGVYKIAREPGGTTVIAATRTGLYQRPTAPDVDVNWDRPAQAPFKTFAGLVTDALWTPAIGTRPKRLWVWVQGGAERGLWVLDAGGAEFKKVAVDAAPYGYPAGRGVLAASTPATQIWVLADQSPNPALFRVTNPEPTPPGTVPQASGVNNVPDVFHGSGFYNLALAVNPAGANRVTVAGSWFGDASSPTTDAALLATPDGARTDFDAAILVADVAPDPANGNQLSFGLGATPFTMLGMGVHPDVHALAFSNNGATLWCGCDGGVWRSERPASIAGFYARNHGMSISESNYIAQHPVCEGNLVVGLQDNGTVTRVSSAVWRVHFKGDGGGVVMDALRPDRWFAQYTQGAWNSHNAAGTGPLVRPAPLGINTTERDAAAFYSSAAGIAHRRENPPGTFTPISQTLIGTKRLWYSDDFGASWVTLRAGSDPLPANNLVQDDLGAPISVCRWQDPDHAWALTDSALFLFSRTPGSHNAGGAGTWAQASIISQVPPGKKEDAPTQGPIHRSPKWTDIHPNPLPGAAGQPSIGALYLGTVGHPTDAAVDTLWWYDGTGPNGWHATKLRTAVPAPVLSIAVDNAFINEVYAGTTVGVWRGTRTQAAGSPPTWQWEQRVNGLPEAAVEDLAIFSHGGLRLLRAAIAARGMWEMRLDVADPPDLTYLRAHDDDLRHRAGSAVTLQKDGKTLRSWHGSPDVRPRVAPAAVPAPSSLPWRRTTMPNTDAARELLRRFQTALRAAKPADANRIVANGRWDCYFSEVLRDNGAPTVAAGGLPAAIRITTAYWNAQMAAGGTAEPWGSGTATEADLLELTPNLVEHTRAETSCSLPRKACRVDIVVHHRGLDPRPGGDVRVTLLKWVDPRTTNRGVFSDSTTWQQNANVPWTPQVNTLLNGPSGADPGALGSGWSFVGTTDATRRVTLGSQTLTALEPGVVTFDLNLSSGVKKDTVVLLVAVIRAGADINLPAATLETLAMNHRNVAVRSVRVT